MCHRWHPLAPPGTRSGPGGPIPTWHVTPRRSNTFTGVLCALLVAVPLVLEAQTEAPSHTELSSQDEGIVVHGRVTDRTTDEPIPSVRVVFETEDSRDGPTWEGHSDGIGTFVTARLPLGEYIVRIEVQGFSPVSEPWSLEELGDVDLRIGLVPVAIALEPILVAVSRRNRLERQGFYQRRNVGLGFFLTRSEIEALNALRVADLFYRIPGARVSGNSAMSTPAVRLRGGCTPVVVLDGILLTRPANLDDLLQISHLEAIEVYHGATAPIQYSRNTTCGTILVWTRDPQPLERGVFSWRRILVAGGLLGGIILLGR